MSNLKVTEALRRLDEAELMGALKTLTWLSFEISGAREKDLAVKDIVDTVDQTLGLIYEKIWDKFNRQYGILYSLKDRIKKGRKEGETENE